MALELAGRRLEAQVERFALQFAKLFGEYLRVENVLQNYDEFASLKELQSVDLADPAAVETFKAKHYLTDDGPDAEVSQVASATGMVLGATVWLLLPGIALAPATMPSSSPSGRSSWSTRSPGGTTRTARA